MAEHLELVAEIPKVEKLTVQERLEYAKKRRKQQLRRWEREKDSDNGPPPRKKKFACKPVTFEPQFMLLDAATRGDVEEVRKMLENGVDPNICNDDGLTALHQACIDGCEEIIEILLGNGAHLDGGDKELWTPLHAAAACGNDDIVEYLLDQGANIVAINADGNMPIDLVDEENEDLHEILHAEMEEQGFTEEKLNELKDELENRMLLDLKKEVEENKDFELDMENEQGGTMVHVAAANGYEEVLDFLLEQGAAIDIADKDGWQPIHAAAVWGNEVTVEVLVENGADLDAKTNTGDTPLTLCEDPELQQFLVDLKKKVKTNKAKSSKRKRSNSRSLSIKRTSLKDKITISQNEAKAEAILRVHPQLAFLLPKNTESKKDMPKTMDTMPAATEGHSTQNSKTTNTDRQESTPISQAQQENTNNTSNLTRETQKENIDPEQKASVIHKHPIENGQTSPKVTQKSHTEKSQTSTSTRLKQKDKSQSIIDRNAIQDTEKMDEKHSPLKITVKMHTVSNDKKNEQQPVNNTQPDVTMATKGALINDKLPYDKHINSNRQQQEPDVTMGTHHIHNHIPTGCKETQPQPRPDVTMVTKPSTLPRDASKPGLSPSTHQVTRASSDVHIPSTRTNRTPGQKTAGSFSQPNISTNAGDGSNSDLGKPPKSSKTHHAPAPPVTRSSGSLSRSHQPADTSGYPDSFSKRSRPSRENIVDVVATGRLASPTKTVTPNDVNLEPVVGPAKGSQVQSNKQQPNQTQSNSKPPNQPQNNRQLPSQPQNNKQQPQTNQPQPSEPQHNSKLTNQPQNNKQLPSQPQNNKQLQQTNKPHPNQTQNNSKLPNHTQPTQPKQQPAKQENSSLPNQSHPQLREPKQQQQQQQPRESYRRRSSSEYLAVVPAIKVKDDKEQQKKTCCVLM